MTPIATFLKASAFTTLLLSATPALAAPEMQLVCEGGLKSSFCRSLAVALAVEFGPVVVSESPTEGMTSLRFVTEAQSRDVLSGHIAWLRADGHSGTGPTLTLSVADAELDDAMLDRFAAELLRFSRLPL